MSPQTENVMKESLQLLREARPLIAEKLLESPDIEEPFEVSGEWRQEIARRCREIDEGIVDLIPADQVFKKARESFRR